MRTDGLRRFLLVSLTLLLGVHEVAAEPSWPAGIYSYVVVEQDLRDVLQQFGINNGLKIALSDKVQGSVHGPLPAEPPRQFLDRLAQQFGLEWVYDGSIISISSDAEAKTEMIALRDVPFSKLHDGLANAGLLDPRYQFKPIMGGQIALVSGPPRYISIVQDVLAALPKEKTTQPAAAPAGPVAASMPPAPPHRSINLMRGASSSVVEFK